MIAPLMHVTAVGLPRTGVIDAKPWLVDAEGVTNGTGPWVRFQRFGPVCVLELHSVSQPDFLRIQLPSWAAISMHPVGAFREWGGQQVMPTRVNAQMIGPLQSGKTDLYQAYGSIMWFTDAPFPMELAV